MTSYKTIKKGLPLLFIFNLFMSFSFAKETKDLKAKSISERIKRDSLKDIKGFFNNKKKINSFDHLGKSPLIHAALFDRPKVSLFLLKSS